MIFKGTADLWIILAAFLPTWNRASNVAITNDLLLASSTKLDPKKKRLQILADLHWFPVGWEWLFRLESISILRWLRTIRWEAKSSLRLYSNLCSWPEILPASSQSFSCGRKVASRCGLLWISALWAFLMNFKCVTELALIDLYDIIPMI